MATDVSYVKHMKSLLV